MEYINTTETFEIMAAAVGFMAYFEGETPEGAWRSHARLMRQAYPATFDNQLGPDHARKGYEVAAEDQAICYRYGLDGYSEYL